MLLSRCFACFSRLRSIGEGFHMVSWVLVSSFFLCPLAVFPEVLWGMDGWPRSVVWPSLVGRLPVVSISPGLCAGGTVFGLAGGPQRFQLVVFAGGRRCASVFMAWRAGFPGVPPFSARLFLGPFALLCSHWCLVGLALAVCGSVAAALFVVQPSLLRRVSRVVIMLWRLLGLGRPLTAWRRGSYSAVCACSIGGLGVHCLVLRAFCRFIFAVDVLGYVVYRYWLWGLFVRALRDIAWGVCVWLLLCRIIWRIYSPLGCFGLGCRLAHWVVRLLTSSLDLASFWVR